MNITKPILEIQGLTKYFDAAHGKKVHAVENVSFVLERGETLGIVGESGCGKSSMGRTILKIHEPTSGKIIFDGKDITDYSPKKMMPYRRRMQTIFQDPYASLNPRMTVISLLESWNSALLRTGRMDNGKNMQESLFIGIPIHFCMRTTSIVPRINGIGRTQKSMNGKTLVSWYLRKI